VAAHTKRIIGTGSLAYLYNGREWGITGGSTDGTGSSSGKTGRDTTLGFAALELVIACAVYRIQKYYFLKILRSGNLRRKKEIACGSVHFFHCGGLRPFAIIAGLLKYEWVKAGSD